MRRWAQRLPAVALAALLVAYTRHGVGRLEVSRTLLEVEATTIGMAATSAVSPAVLAANLRRVKQAIELDPLEVGSPVALGGLYLLLDRPAAAQAAYRSALELEQRPEIYLNLGRSQLMAGSPTEATESFRRAVLLSPSLLDEVPEEWLEDVLAGIGSQARAQLEGSR